jgi:hypothetical protein
MIKSVLSSSASCVAKYLPANSLFSRAAPAFVSAPLVILNHAPIFLFRILVDFLHQVNPCFVLYMRDMLLMGRSKAIQRSHLFEFECPILQSIRRLRTSSQQYIF